MHYTPHAPAELPGFFPKIPGQLREQNDQREFSDLRRLELDARNADPAFCPVYLLAHNQNRQQQQNTDTVQRPGQPVPSLRWDPAKELHGSKAHEGADCLFL